MNEGEPTLVHVEFSLATTTAIIPEGFGSFDGAFTAKFENTNVAGFPPAVESSIT